jgi:16S rRNA processing protein RimM
LKDNTTHKRLLVGKINGLFGIKGFVKVFSYSDPKEQIVSYKKWLIKDGEGFNEVAISGKKTGKNGYC